MARTVSADVTLTVNIQDSDPQGTIAANGDQCTVNYTSTLQYTGATPGSAKEWSGTITLSAAATTLDLTSLTGLRGTTETFSKVYAMAIINNSTMTGYSLMVGYAASNIWAPFWSDSVNVETVPPKGSRFLKENFDTGWTVDGTHKNLKLDPGSNTFTATVIIIGS